MCHLSSFTRSEARQLALPLPPSAAVWCRVVLCGAVGEVGWDGVRATDDGMTHYAATEL